MKAARHPGPQATVTIPPTTRHLWPPGRGHAEMSNHVLSLRKCPRAPTSLRDGPRPTWASETRWDQAPYHLGPSSPHSACSFQSPGLYVAAPPQGLALALLFIQILSSQITRCFPLSFSPSVVRWPLISLKRPPPPLPSPPCFVLHPSLSGPAIVNMLIYSLAYCLAPGLPGSRESFTGTEAGLAHHSAPGVSTEGVNGCRKPPAPGGSGRRLLAAQVCLLLQRVLTLQ